MEFKIIPFELKSTSGDGSEFDGFANAFHNLDSAQEIVAPGAFVDTIPQFLANGFIGGVNHDWNNPIGSPKSAEEQSKGLFVEGKISPTQHGKDCMVLLKDRVIKKLSIGYRVLADEMLEDADACMAYWDNAGYTPTAQDVAGSKYGARLLTKLHLYEFSPVTVPANSLADITRVKRYAADDLQNKRAFENFLRDSGLSRKEAVEAIAMLFKGLQREADEATSRETETPPSEPTTPTEQSAKEIEAQREEPEPAPPSVVIDLSAANRQVMASAHYANLQLLQAKYGLHGDITNGRHNPSNNATP